MRFIDAYAEGVDFEALGFFGTELVAIDGSKFKASNGQRRHFSAEHLREMLAQIDQRMEDHLPVVA